MSLGGSPGSSIGMGGCLEQDFAVGGAPDVGVRSSYVAVLASARLLGSRQPRRRSSYAGAGGKAGRISCRCLMRLGGGSERCQGVRRESWLWWPVSRGEDRDGVDGWAVSNGRGV